MTKRTPIWPFLIIAGYIALAEGVHLFAVWNMIPVAIGYVLLRGARRKGLRTKPELAFIVASCGLLLFAHAAWMFDWGGTATGSSTSALIFIFLPIYASILGAIAWGVMRLFTRRTADS